MKKKNGKILSLALSTIILLASSNGSAVAAPKEEFGENGVSYILLSTDFDEPGIYRMNAYDGSVAGNPWRLFKTRTIKGKVSGLAANQQNEVFLLSAMEGDKFDDAPVGWLPSGIKFKEDSSIYVKVAPPSDGDGMTEYVRAGMPHQPYKYKTKSSGHYWYKDLAIDGVTYPYVVHFGGPRAVKYLNGSNGTLGTPIWDGKYWPDSSVAAALKHPTDPQKIILPSHFGALSYYLYGTKNESAIEGLPMNGEDKRDTYTYKATNGAGYFNGDKKHRSGTMFACIIKRIYSRRMNSLDLYSAIDPTTEASIKTDQNMSKTQSGVLATTDVSVRESYGKLCGDNCIDGGELPGNKPIETALSTVTVVTSTAGNRYGFNPVGVPKGANSTEASLRVVKKNGSTSVIDISTDSNGQYFSPRITNANFLASKGITPSSMRTIGVSSNFTEENADDFIYGSQADKFVVQDSWWGLGGVAYEYYKSEDDENTGKIVKLDYMGNKNPVPETVSSNFKGKIDSIGIDGNGYLYALKTEENPTDNEMKNIEAPTGASAVNPTFTQTPGLPTNNLSITYSGWKRDTSTTSGGETINNPAIDIPEGSQRTGDYKVATVYQKVFKTIKRYPQGTGSLGTEESRGQLAVGYDAWTNNLRLNANGSLSWSYATWRQCSPAERASELPAELAVVNVAASPVSINGTEDHFVCVTTPGYAAGSIINEQDKLTFKVEGYKPKVNGVQTDFKTIGNIGTNFADVKLNTIPAPDGTYAHDENSDGNKSGFPSTMFEDKSRRTEVTWKIALVEDIVPVDIDKAKIVSRKPDVKASSNSKYLDFTYEFKQPGRYIIQANVKYHYFNNITSAKRPTDLTSAEGTFTTKPLLISVMAKELNLNNSVSYVDNIEIKVRNNHINYNDTKGLSNDAQATFLEDNVFGENGITISFDARFARVENDNTSGNLITHPGVGVWEYDYYRYIYANKLSGCKGVVPPTDLPTTIAYNHVGGYGAPETVYSKTIYNPGYKKDSDERSSYDAGTTINKEPNEHDKKFIQWALYLVPIDADKNFIGTIPGMKNRGDCIARGDCVNARFTLKDANQKKYGIELTIPQIPTSIENLFKTPRDPNNYTLALEIVYPRVSWLNNDLGQGDGNKYFSSLVPYGFGEEELGMNSPIHVVSKIANCPVNTYVNQSFTAKDGTNLFKGGEDCLLVCARDNTVPQFRNIDVTEKETGSSKSFIANTKIIETTGDESAKATVSCEVIDNNPFLKKAQEVSLFVQKVNSNNKYFSNKFNDLKFANINSVITNDSLVNPKSDYYNQDIPNIASLSYKAKLDSIALDCHKDYTEITSKNLDDSDKKINLKLDSWVGELAYFWIGQFCDGLGLNGDNIEHGLYNSQVFANSEGIPNKGIIESQNSNNQAILASPVTFFQRIDNDPPTIEVEIISQNDNKRWKYQLLEINQDLKNNPQSSSDLAKCKLVYKQYVLSSNATIDNITEQVEGAQGPLSSGKTKNGITSLGKHIVKISETGAATADLDTAVAKLPIPTVRRAARLLVNVNIFDNCGFLPLSNATISITDSQEPSNNLSKTINTDASNNESDGNLIDKFKTAPRGTFYYNAPLKVADDSNQPQLKITVSTADEEGNARTIVIPIRVVESTFETRVLETKEGRQ